MIMNIILLIRIIIKEAIMIFKKKHHNYHPEALTHFVGALSLHLSFPLLTLLVQNCALDLQVVDHPLPGQDGGDDHDDHDHDDDQYNIIIDIIITHSR